MINISCLKTSEKMSGSPKFQNETLRHKAASCQFRNLISVFDSGMNLSFIVLILFKIDLIIFVAQ